MPGMYQGDEYDIAGFTVGVVDKKKIIDGTTIAPGDVVLGFASSGIHSNGYSLVRRLLLEECGYALDQRLPELNDAVLGDVLIEPTRIYVKSALKLIEQVNVKGMAHITGGGFIENIPRVLPEGVNVNVEYGSWPILPIFQLMQDKGAITNRDMFTTFNMGIGLIVVVPADQAEEALKVAAELGEAKIPNRNGNGGQSRRYVYRSGRVMGALRLAVFASGQGTNFQALVDAVRQGELDATIELLVCDKPSAPVVERARKAGVDTFIFVPKEYPSREAYETEILAGCGAGVLNW